VFPAFCSECLALEDVNDRLYRNASIYIYTLRNIPEERGSHVHRGRSLKSDTCLITSLTSLTSYAKFLSIPLCQNASSYFWQKKQISIYKFYFLISTINIKSKHLEIFNVQEYFFRTQHSSFFSENELRDKSEYFAFTCSTLRNLNIIKIIIL